MAGLTLTTADQVLREDYKGPLREQLNNTNQTLVQFEKNTDDIVGRRAIVPLHVQRSPAVGSRAELGTLPTAGVQGYIDEQIPLRYHYGRIQISGPVIKAMASDRGSFVRAVKSETSGMENDLKREINRQLFGTSDGVIATCGVTTASTTVVLAAATGTNQTRQLAVGDIVDIGTVANPQLLATAQTITAAAPTASPPTITISGAAITTTAADFVFRAGAGGSGASQKEMTGLQTQISATGTLFNVNPATYPIWGAYADSGNGGALRSPTEVLIGKNLMQTQILSGMQPDYLVTSDGAFRSFSTQLTTLKRFPDTQELKGGFKGLSIQSGGAACALVWDRDCPGGGTGGGTMYGLRTDKITEFYSSDWDWMDLDGSVLFRVANTDAYEATLYKYADIATTQRDTHFVLNALTES